jgi:transcription elongation factor Elf1
LRNFNPPGPSRPAITKEEGVKIQKIISQHRRDFTAIYECEHCGNVEEGYGYDDANFHQNVIPNKKCKNCGKKADENYRPLQTKYKEGDQI